MKRAIALINCRLEGGKRTAIVVVDGRIASVGANVPAGALTIDLDGRLVMPALVDAHLHLDKTLLGLPWHAHSAGDSVPARIAAEKALRRQERPSIVACGGRLLGIAVRNGTLAVRSHVDVDDETRLANVEALLRLREAWADTLTIQLVAFPQSGISRTPGVSELLEEAVRMGCDLVGGLDPLCIDGDLDGHLDVVFGIAARHGVDIDIHLHGQNERGIGEILAIADRTKALGMSGHVAVSHAFCLGSIAPDRAAKVGEQLAAAGVSIITTAPGAAPMPPVKLLRRSGVHVAAGSDNIRDAWSPFGNANMIERCWLVSWRSGFRTDDDIARTLDLGTTEAAHVLALDSYGMRVGSYADLVAFRRNHIVEVVVERPSPDFIFRRGRVLRDDSNLAPSHLVKSPLPIDG